MHMHMYTLHSSSAFQEPLAPSREKFNAHTHTLACAHAPTVVYRLPKPATINPSVRYTLTLSISCRSRSWAATFLRLCAVAAPPAKGSSSCRPDAAPDAPPPSAFRRSWSSSWKGNNGEGGAFFFCRHRGFFVPSVVTTFSSVVDFRHRFAYILGLIAISSSLQSGVVVALFTMIVVDHARGDHAGRLHTT